MNVKKILVVEDDVLILKMLRRSLEKAGYQVLGAPDGETALKHANDNPDIKVMLFDINLPDTNGIDLCKTLKKDWPDAIFYAMTGYLSYYGEEEIREAGFKKVFIKPVPLKTYLDAMRRAFEELESA